MNSDRITASAWKYPPKCMRKRGFSNRSGRLQKNTPGGCLPPAARLPPSVFHGMEQVNFSRMESTYGTWKVNKIRPKSTSLGKRSTIPGKQVNFCRKRSQLIPYGNGIVNFESKNRVNLFLGKDIRSYSVLSIQLNNFLMRNHEKRKKEGYIYIYNYIIYYRYRNFFTCYTPERHSQTRELNTEYWVTSPLSRCSKHTRLRSLHHSPICFENPPSRIKIVERNLPKCLTTRFEGCIFVLVHHRVTLSSTESKITIRMVLMKLKNLKLCDTPCNSVVKE